MTKKNRQIVIAVLALTVVTLPPAGIAQQPNPPKVGPAGLTAQGAIAAAEQGHCKDALPTLRKALTTSPSKDERKKAGVLGVRCAIGMDDRVMAGEFLGQLGKQFPNDSDVLYVVAHAYSDLSMRAAGELAEKAPQSVEARRMNAEALEVQGKWDEAAKQYEEILAQNPKLPGIHYLIGRILLSKPDPDPARIASAKQEFIQELEIDPKNPGAEYVLGVLARQDSDWEQAATHFSRAAKLDASFGDAFWGWGVSLVSAKRYEEAIAPLQAAVRLQPGNPSAHYNLGMALSRSGRAEEAQKEFAIQKEIIARLDEKKNARTEAPKPE
jgi:tetratricopeptide (TPR) repeat protein